MFDFNDKTVLVTGASGGLGQEIARLFAKKNAKLILTASRENVLKEIKEKIKNHNNNTICNIKTCDLNDLKQVEKLVPECEEKFGNIDILVNNAGINADGLTLRLKKEQWDKVMNVNLNANFILTKAVIRGMSKRRYGRIVNITSVIAVTGNAGQAAYSASKAAIIGFSKSIAREFAQRNITVNCLAPGYIDTPMTQKLGQKIKESILLKIPTAKIATPYEIAAAVIYLASEEAAYVTGETLHINGGMAMS